MALVQRRPSTVGSCVLHWTDVPIYLLRLKICARSLHTPTASQHVVIDLVEDTGREYDTYGCVSYLVYAGRHSSFCRQRPASKTRQQCVYARCIMCEDGRTLVNAVPFATSALSYCACVLYRRTVHTSYNTWAPMCKTWARNATLCPSNPNSFANV